MLQVHDLEGFIRDGVKEAHLVFGAESATEHPASFRYDWGRNEEALFGPQEIAARLMVRFASAARLEQHARVDNQHDGSVEAERTPGGLNSALIKFLADRLMLSEEFVCQSLAGAMYVEGLTNGLIGSAYEGLEGSPPVRSIDELADELRGCDTALACAFCDDGRNVVGQVNNGGHRPQRTYRPRQVSTDFSVALAEAWLLADADGCAHHFGVSRAIAPCDVELLCDPERPLANLCRRSGMPGVREGMLPRQGSRRSAGESYSQLGDC